MRDSVTAHIPVMVPVEGNIAAPADSLQLLADSTALSADSITALADSTVSPAGEAAVLMDFLRTDGYAFSPQRPDSLRVHTLTASGEPGIPTPYTMRSDNAVTLTLILCFVLFFFALEHSRGVIIKQAKEFFSSSNTDDDRSFQFTLTPFHLLMVLINAIMLSVGSYWAAGQAMPGTYAIDSPILVIGVFLAAFMAYFALKWIAYAVVNGVFFGGRKSLQWHQAILLLTALEGTLLFPIVLFAAYFSTSVEKALFSFTAVLILNKILTFYKSWNIFFRQNSRYMQNFLYFCALEITPLLAFGGLWVFMVKLLKVNY